MSLKGLTDSFPHFPFHFLWWQLNRLQNRIGERVESPIMYVWLPGNSFGRCIKAMTPARLGFDQSMVTETFHWPSIPDSRAFHHNEDMSQSFHFSRQKLKMCQRMLKESVPTSYSRMTSFRKSRSWYTCLALSVRFTNSGCVRFSNCFISSFKLANLSWYILKDKAH